MIVKKIRPIAIAKKTATSTLAPISSENNETEEIVTISPIISTSHIIE